MGTDELLYLRFGNTMIEPIWNRNHIACVQITMAESFGVADRGHFYDPVGALRDVVVNHLMQLVGVAAMEAPAGNDAKTLKDAKYAFFRAIENATPRTTCAGSTRATSTSTASRRTRRRRPTRRCASTSTTGAGRACRGSYARARRCPSRRRSCARSSASLRGAVHGGRASSPRAEPVRRQARPRDGHAARPRCAPRRRRRPQPITLDMEFAQEGGEGPTPYEVLLLDAMRGDRPASRARTASKRRGA